MRKDVSIHAPTITITNILLLIIIIIGIKTNTYLWIRSQRRIYSPPAPAESWGQSGICQRLSQIFPSSSHRSSSSTAPVRSVPAVVCSPLIPPNWSSVCESVWQCVCVCSGPSSSSSSSMLKQQNEFFFVSQRWDDCLSANQQHAGSVRDEEAHHVIAVISKMWCDGDFKEHL